MRTGYGVRLQFNVEVEWLSFRNYFDPNTNPSYMAAGTWVADLDYIVDYMGGSTTGASDDEQRYFWLTPNYNTPDEQWIRVEPDSDSFQTGFGTKTWSRKMTCSFIASDLYKSVQRTTRSLGWTSVGEGLVDYAATTVTGTGTSFLRDFLPGYYIEIDGYELLINSVTSDTEMDADNPGIGPYTNEAYNIIQSGYNTIKNWYYPVYTFTTFTGQQLGWGYNWGNYWSGSS
ncbi:MAG: hypothetical protein HYZ23_02005 [Chloroflexi bacterium]|nr:hypothetical protein [Chloroflexota bacterium]